MTNIIGLDKSDGQRPWERTLGEFLALAAERDPDKVFVEISGHRITYRQFQERVNQAAGMFLDLGVSHSDRVCLFLFNCPEFLYCWFGLSFIGAITVPINTAYKRDEAAYILNNAEASVLVAHHSLLDVAEEAAGLCPSLRHKLMVEDGPQNQLGLVRDIDGWTDFSTAMSQSRPPISLTNPS